MRGTAILRYLVILALLSCGRRTLAGEELRKMTAELAWKTDDAGCLSGQRLEATVNERWGRRVFSGSPADIRVVGGVRSRRSVPGYEARIEMFSSSGQSMGSRTLSTDSDTCSALDEPILLVTGLMLDVSERQLLAEERKRPPKRWQFEPELAAGIGLGILPRVALSGGARLRIAPPHFWSFSAGATLYQAVDAAGGPGGGSLRLWTVDLDACPLRLGDASRLEGCALARVGAVHVKGFGYDLSARAQRFWCDLGIAVRGRIKIAGRLGVVASVAAQVPVTRYDFYYTNAAGTDRSLFTAAPVVGVATLGMGLGF